MFKTPQNVSLLNLQLISDQAFGVVYIYKYTTAV